MVPRAFVDRGRRELARVGTQLRGVWTPVRARFSDRLAGASMASTSATSGISAALNAGWTAVRRASRVDITSAIRNLRPRGPISSPLLVLDIFLIVLSAALIISISRALLAPDFLSPIQRRRAVDVSPAPSNDRGRAGRGSVGYDVIAARNLFDPGRSETTRSAGVRPDASPQPKPLLYGVILSDDRALGLAYLQDPVTKRIAAYRIGDTVAGGRIEGIERDRVLIRRGPELVEVSMNRSHTPPPPDAVPVSSESTTSAVPTRRIPKD